MKVSLGGCGDDDPTDEWIGTWTLEISNGDNYKRSREAAVKESFIKAADVETWDFVIEEYEITAEFTFGDDSHWEFVNSQNSNDGEIRGKSKWVDGKFGAKALHLDPGAWIGITPSDSMNGDFLQGEFSVSAWINPNFLGSAWERI